MANTAFNHDPALTVAASNTTAGAAVKWVASKNLGESLIILDSGGNGRIGLAGDLDLITLTSGTVTVAGTVAATTLTGAGSGITDLAAGNIASGTIATARLGSGTANNSVFLRGDNTWAAATSSFIGVRVENSSNQSVANNSVAKLTFDASVTKFDTDTMHSSSNADRITFTTAGYYWCGLSYMWEGHATGRRNVWVSSTLAAGGGNTLVRQTISPSTADEQHNVLSFIYQFAAGDYIEWYAHQTSGTSLNIHADNESSAVAMAYKIG